MASPRLADKQLEKVYGRRLAGVTALDQPEEIGYRCPKGHKGARLHWSEFKEHIRRRYS